MELEIEPVQYYEQVIKRGKRVSHCLPEQGVGTAATTAKIIPKSKLSNQLIVDFVLKKYFEHLPPYRQFVILEQNVGVELSRQTLDDAVMAVGDLLRAMSRSLKASLFCGGYIHGDESPVPCQIRDKKSATIRHTCESITDLTDRLLLIFKWIKADMDRADC